MNDPEHKCHCSHVVVVMHDFKRINWAIGIVFAAVLATMVHEVWAMEKSHVREDAAPGRNGERLFEDRVSH